MKINNFWSYYLSFEEDIDKLSRYIEICEDNYGVYSVELTRLYLSICSEIDVILKALCELLSPGCNAINIKEYMDVILTTESGLVDERALCHKYDLTFTPWTSWRNRESPSWWKKHNGVKHRRLENYKEANLLNVLTSLSALYLLNLHWSYAMHRKEIPEKIFHDFSSVVRQHITRVDLFRIDDFWAYLTEI